MCPSPIRQYTGVLLHHENTFQVFARTSQCEATQQI
jgi:hypothetical protein